MNKCLHDVRVLLLVKKLKASRHSIEARLRFNFSVPEIYTGHVASFAVWPSPACEWNSQKKASEEPRLVNIELRSCISTNT